jgi:hypothetical protein
MGTGGSFLEGKIKECFEDWTLPPSSGKTPTDSAWDTKPTQGTIYIPDRTLNICGYLDKNSLPENEDKSRISEM